MSYKVGDTLKVVTDGHTTKHIWNQFEAGTKVVVKGIGGNMVRNGTTGRMLHVQGIGPGGTSIQQTLLSADLVKVRATKPRAEVVQKISDAVVKSQESVVQSVPQKVKRKRQQRVARSLWSVEIVSNGEHRSVHMKNKRSEARTAKRQLQATAEIAGQKVVIVQYARGTVIR